MRIIKAPGAKSNTYLAVIEGGERMRDEFKSYAIDVRFTSDDVGETLSLAYGDRQFVVPFERVEKLIKYTREKRRQSHV